MILIAIALTTPMEYSIRTASWSKAKFEENAAVAGPMFRRLAKDYELDWRRNPNPANAQMRGQCEYLGGNLPSAIAAFRAGLRTFPADAKLQRALEICRAEVASSSSVNLRQRKQWRSRFSEWDAWFVALASVLMVTVGTARHLTTRDGWALPLAVVGLIALGAVALWHWQCEREIADDLSLPAHVLKFDTALRTGNGESYPPRLPALLHLGSEVREVGQRGGWIQVQLESGEAGWLPEEALLQVK